MKKYIFAVLCLALISSCDKEGNGSDDPKFENLEYFYENASSLKVDVAFETGATPYTNTGFGSNANFDFADNNLNNLFAGRSNPITVSIDKQISEMTQIPAQNKSGYSTSDIVALADAHQPLQSSENQGVVFIMYLDGYYDINGQEQTNVLGVSVGSFTVAIFKPVMESISGGGPLSSNPKYQVEQATIVHEVGHAVGLVDNGVAMHTNHIDGAHGKHCINQNCVMYWANEGASGASSLFGGASVGQLVFGQECIDDITNF